MLEWENIITTIAMGAMRALCTAVCLRIEMRVCFSKLLNLCITVRVRFSDRARIMIFEARIKCSRVANVIITYTAAVNTSVAIKY